ncbi:MAG: Crp/Fnr family transcriptional regulator [Gammaproteobacteria bacterium]|nr:Crp/Fnr family transcriptional regulator [Gammaproteobacteria bacterium]
MKPESPFYADSLQCLKASSLFNQLDTAALAGILKRGRRETWKHRRLLPMEEIWQRFHILLSGRVRLSRCNPESGRMITLFLHGSGDGFCLFSLLDGQPHDVMLEPLDDVTLLSMPMYEARQWIEEHPDFNRTLLPYIGQQMSTLANLAADLALHDTETRLARLILRHIDETSSAHIEPTLINDLSHESLAEMIGSVRVVVNRQLQHWKQEGIVDAHRGYLMVEKLNELAQRAERRLVSLPDNVPVIPTQ